MAMSDLYKVLKDKIMGESTSHKTHHVAPAFTLMIK